MRKPFLSQTDRNFLSFHHLDNVHLTGSPQIQCDHINREGLKCCDCGRTLIDINKI